MRRLANSYRELGDDEGFLLYGNKALDYALRKQAEDANRVSN